MYKEAKLLRASVKNSEKIDRAFEKAINVVFYTMVACIILSQVGLSGDAGKSFSAKFADR